VILLTIKELSNELKLSKPTISKIISELNIQVVKIGNRFELSDEQCELIKSQISKNKNEKKSQKTKKSKNENQILFFQEQIAIKDALLLEKEKQISELTKILKVSQEQNLKLIDALQAAQALHAGTISKQIEDQSNVTNHVIKNSNEPLKDAAINADFNKEKSHWWSNFFRKNRKI
jgi:hypothetical protein